MADIALALTFVTLPFAFPALVLFDLWLIRWFAG